MVRLPASSALRAATSATSARSASSTSQSCPATVTTDLPQATPVSRPMRVGTPGRALVVGHHGEVADTPSDERGEDAIGRAYVHAAPDHHPRPVGHKPGRVLRAEIAVHRAPYANSEILDIAMDADELAGDAPRGVEQRNSVVAATSSCVTIRRIDTLDRYLAGSRPR